MSCHLQPPGAIELYFYGELPASERLDVEAHLRSCADCRGALHDLSVIRAALASRPDVAAPPEGEWSGFMARLNARIGSDGGAAQRQHAVRRGPVRQALRGRLLTASLAAAALLALAAAGHVMYRAQSANAPAALVGERAPGPAPHPRAEATPDPALLSLSEGHFERSKLVVLGLATRDTAHQEGEDWTYERELASTLLGDTRLYRLAAEERGMGVLADVLEDLELVLLETAMSEARDEEALKRVQRLIRRRDLLTKMNVASIGS